MQVFLRRNLAANTVSATRRFIAGRPSMAISEVSDAKELKALEDAANKLKRLLAASVMKNPTLNEMLTKNF